MIELRLNEKNLKVLTPFGINTFDGIKKIKSKELIEFFLQDNLSIKVTPSHKFIANNDEILANDLKVFDILSTKNGDKKIINIKRHYNENGFDVYDFYNVANDNHSYYANNIINHNCCDFILSGETAIAPEDILWIKNNLVKEPIAKEGSNEEFWIWKYPEPQLNYIIGADVAKGGLDDYSTAQIICVETFEQVAEFQSRCDGERLAKLMCKWGIDYNNALLVPENNNFGQRTIQKILDLNYQNLFYFDKKFKGIIYPGFMEESNIDKKEPGFLTTSKTRPMILENLINLINESVIGGMQNIPAGITIRSSRLCYELNSWGYYNGRLDHAKGHHDDLIFALALAAFIKSVYSRITENERLSINEFMKFFSHDKSYADMAFGIQKGKSNVNPYKIGDIDISFLTRD